jgi:hypothetical protein
LVIVPESNNDSTLAALAGPVRPYLRSGDAVMLSSGADVNQSPASAKYLNGRLSLLAPQLPSWIVYEARTGGLANVESLVGGLSSSFQAIVYDYEPGFESEFTRNFTGTLTNFALFAHACHAGGFQAVGYPIGIPLWGERYEQYNWNYGTLLASTGVDGLQIQDQGAAHSSLNAWNRSLTTLADQYNGYLLPANDMSLQLTLADGTPNQVNESVAFAAYSEAAARGVGQLILFWNLASLGALLQLLHEIRG